MIVRVAVSQPRFLLRRLHSVMAGGGSAQEKLDRVVRVLAQNMVAEVCSLYLARAGGILELFATEGLKEEAVHQTRLRFGEGLVGLVAERGLPLNLSEAPQHPRFVYRSETGEDIYHIFLGVPILRSGRVACVLVFHNVVARRYNCLLYTSSTVAVKEYQYSSTDSKRTQSRQTY